jgi:Zn-dependent protease
MFDRSLTIARVRGIPIRLHVSLLLFLPYVVYVTTAQFDELAARVGVKTAPPHLPPFAWGIVLAVGVFASILLHELAHSVIALRAGARVRSITLMMLGGVSQIEDEVPAEREAWMAFAGPLTSFALGLACYGGYRLAAGSEPAIALLALAVTNVALGAFNLLPAFPMDGGRVLRGLLAGRLGRLRATRVAAGLGRAVAVALGLFGLLSFNVLLVLIALFVYMGAGAERSRLEARDVLRGVPIARLMTERLGEARLDESAHAVAERLFHDNLVGARVVDGWSGPAPGEPVRRTVGVVTIWDLARRAARGTADVPMSDAMRTDLPVVHTRDDASRMLDALSGSDANAVVVLDDADEVVGLVTPDELARAVALGSARRPSAASADHAGPWAERPALAPTLPCTTVKGVAPCRNESGRSAAACWLPERWCSSRSPAPVAPARTATT